MPRILQISLFSLSKPKTPLTSVFQSLLEAHGRSTSRVHDILRGNLDVSSSRKSVNLFRTFCTGRDLSTKKCIPCNSKDLRPMTEEAAKDLITQVDGWNLLTEAGPMKLTRSWKVKSFTKGLELFKLVADVAEAEDHHPDLHLVGWNNVTIEIWTHSVETKAECSGEIKIISHLNDLQIRLLPLLDLHCTKLSISLTLFGVELCFIFSSVGCLIIFHNKQLPVRELP